MSCHSIIQDFLRVRVVQRELASERASVAQSYRGVKNRGCGFAREITRPRLCYVGIKGRPANRLLNLHIALR